MVHGSTEADPVCQPRRVADKRTPLDTTRVTHVETTWLPSGHTNTDTTRSPPTHVNDYRQRYTGTGLVNRTTGTGGTERTRMGQRRRGVLTTTRRGVGTTTTNRRGGG